MPRISLIFCCLFLSLSLSAFSQDTIQDITKNTISSTSIGKVDHSDFNQGVNHSPYQLINGRMPGLGMYTAGNDPNGEFILRVRGLSTLQSQTRPLLVIDGFVTDDLLTIDPNDISEISLLRDAAAASIYGVRGGNGVLLISTKTAGYDPVSVSYNATFGIERAIYKISPASTSDYKSYAGSVDLGSDQNWIDLISQTGNTSVHSLALSKNTKSLSVRASMNIRQATGTLIGTGFDQLNARINLQQKALDDKLLLQFMFANTSRKSDYGFREAIKYAYSAIPTTPVYTSPSSPHGGYYQTLFFDSYNPVAIIEQNENSGKERSTFVGIKSTYQFDGRLKGINFELSYQLMDDNDFAGTYYGKNSYYIGENWNGLAIRNSQNGSTQQIASAVSYTRSFNNIGVQVSSGYQIQDYKTSSFYAQGGNFLTDAFSYNNMAASGDFQKGIGTVSSVADSYKIASWVNTASLVFREKYFLNATGVYSGSTRLGEDNKWGFFPSFGGGVQWNEGIGFLNYAKIRLSWGKAGNIPQRSNLSKSILTASTYPSSYQNGNFLPIYYTVRDENRRLKWEEKSELNIGADFTFLNNRVNGSIDWFSNKVSGLISPVNIPSPPNLSYTMFANLGEIQNQGVEINLNINAKKTTQFLWDLNFNLSRVKTTVNSLSEPNYALTANGELSIGILSDAGGCSSHGVNLIEEGAVLGQIQGPVFSGIVDGMPTHVDQNGDGGYCDCPDDFTVLGNALPKFTFGFGNRILYHDFEISFLLRGSSGHSKINAYRIYQESSEVVAYANLIKTSYFEPSLRNTHLSDRYVENASFIKLDNISLKYHVPSALKLTVSATIQNLFTISKYTGMDPEVTYGDPVLKGKSSGPINTSPLVSGLESRGNYFPSRTYSLGISLVL
ncbi:MAG: hypothetical protein C0490_03405 [Marivirga sp.]|nr:hypothetical protein [Marivirga sp.]